MIRLPALISASLLLLLGACATPQVPVVVEKPVVIERPIPAVLTAPCPRPDYSEGMTWGELAAFTASLLDALNDCDRARSL